MQSDNYILDLASKCAQPSSFLHFSTAACSTPPLSEAPVGGGVIEEAVLHISVEALSVACVAFPVREMK